MLELKGTVKIDDLLESLEEDLKQLSNGELVLESLLRGLDRDYPIIKNCVSKEKVNCLRETLVYRKGLLEELKKFGLKELSDKYYFCGLEDESNVGRNIYLYLSFEEDGFSAHFGVEGPFANTLYNKVFESFSSSYAWVNEEICRKFDFYSYNEYLNDCLSMDMSDLLFCVSPTRDDKEQIKFENKARCLKELIDTVTKSTLRNIIVDDLIRVYQLMQ